MLTKNENPVLNAYGMKSKDPPSASSFIAHALTVNFHYPGIGLFIGPRDREVHVMSQPSFPRILKALQDTGIVSLDFDE
jgi:hypothetical protein